MTDLENIALKDWPVEAIEAMTVQCVSLPLLKVESELYKTKSWDYRYLHPAIATQIFADCYSKARKHAVERRTDIWIGRNMKGLKKSNLFELDPRTITGLWKGRQMADKYGVPYDFYCENAMFFADVVRWENLPTPVHLYGTKVPAHLQGTDFAVSLVEFVIGRWMERVANSANFANHEAYLIENYAAGEHQVEYINYLTDKIRESTFPEAVLSCVLERGQISEEFVLQVFPRTGKQLYSRAVSLT